jgi:hypothetical protein
MTPPFVGVVGTVGVTSFAETRNGHERKKDRSAERPFGEILLRRRSFLFGGLRGQAFHRLPVKLHVGGLL